MFEKILTINTALGRRFPKGDDPFKMLARLLEEAGELAKEVHHMEGEGVKRQKHGEPDRDHLAKEVQDVLRVAFQVASHYNLIPELQASVEKSYRQVLLEHPDLSSHQEYSPGSLHMYSDLAEWWPILSEPEDYQEEAELARKLIVEACLQPPVILLELGSGGGNNASHLKAHFQMALVDLSPGMLAVSRDLNPECEHLQGDMRTVRLGRQFDAVFIHDAVMYLVTEIDLRQAMATAFIHCQPGGAVLFCPDCVRETFKQGTDHGGHDRDERGMRYLEWTVDPNPDDNTYVVDFAFLLREGESLRLATDHHTFGLFKRQEWLDWLAAAGFESVHSILDPSGRDLFIGVRPLG